MNKYKIEQCKPDMQSWEDALNDYAEADSASLAIELAKDYIIENADENYLDEHDLTVEEFADQVKRASYRALKLVSTEDGEVWAPCGIAPVSVNFKVYGLPNHRQRESFYPSERQDLSTDDNVRILEIFNSDRTGTNDYNILRITRETREECFEELEGQLSDGLYENSNWGVYQVIDDTDLMDIVGEEEVGTLFHVYVWDAANRMWTDSIEDISYFWAETEENAIQYAIEYMTDFVYHYIDYDEEERAEQMEFWSNPNHYKAELDED